MNDKVGIKVTKDDLFFWSRVLPVLTILIHLMIITFIFISKFWLLYLVYLYFAVHHFLFAKMWRGFLLNDVYLNEEKTKVMFINLKGHESEFNSGQIVELSTCYGITKVLILDNNKKIKRYFRINSRDDLKYLSF